MTAYQINPGSMYTGGKPVRDPKYLAFLRRFPCVACKATRRIEAAHFGIHSMDEKASDLDALPLCAACHRTGEHCAHKLNREAFQLYWSIEIAALQRMFRRFFRIKFPDHKIQGIPMPRLKVCECGYEDFVEEFEAGDGCPVCGRAEERERAA